MVELFKIELEANGFVFDKNGNIPVWGQVSSSGRPYYTFRLTDKDKYIMFTQTQQNPKAPKFIIRKVDSEKVTAEE